MRPAALLLLLLLLWTRQEVTSKRSLTILAMEDKICRTKFGDLDDSATMRADLEMASWLGLAICNSIVSLLSFWMISLGKDFLISTAK